MRHLERTLGAAAAITAVLGCAKRPATDVSPSVDVPVVPVAATPLLVASSSAPHAPVVPRSFPGATKDPTGGVFGLDDARKGGLEGADPMMATIETSEGDLTCELFSDRAPKTVANFVGLARGIRPWKGPNGWINAPLYDGTTFHRVIDGFMIQGGDPKGDGTGEPGFTLPDEIWPGAKHDRAGLLCMANRGPNTNGAQFFIMDAPAAHLDASYTIFGACAPVAVVHAIAKVPKDGRDRPLTPVVIRRVVIAPGP